jgi:membrane protein implicated in regulation of membrane protease activity
MLVLFLVAFVTGLLLAGRLMFFGAERRRHRPDATPLRRSEPALVGFLVMFGLAGYLAVRHEALRPLPGLGAAVALGAAWAMLVARVAIVMARVEPTHDPDDPRYRLQGQVGTVLQPIPAEGEGVITYEDAAGPRTCGARSIDHRAIEAGCEVCIERLEDGVAFVEPWTLVEARL